MIPPLPPSPFPLELAPGVEMEFCWIPPGSFLMGSRGLAASEEPRHRVVISRGFYLGRTPVTQKQYEVWTAEEQPPDGPHEHHFKGQPNHPAENVSWNDAMAYCAWLRRAYSSQLRAYEPTLPTEAEWEYACRIVAIDDDRHVRTCETEYYTGDGEAALKEAGWYDEDWNTGSPHPVAGLAPNGAGLRDMHGNVWEWCWDEYDADAYRTRLDGTVDPGSAARAAGELGDHPVRVVRGGSWVDTARSCRAAFRSGGWPGLRYGYRGFRVCLVPGPQTEEQVAPGGGARRDAEAQPEGAVLASDTARFSKASFPRRGTRRDR